MGFSFRKKKGKAAKNKAPSKKEAEIDAATNFKKNKEKVAASKQNNGARSRKRVGGSLRTSSKGFSSPLGTIDETRGDNDDVAGRPEQTPSGVLASLRIIPTKEPGTHDTHDTGVCEMDESLEVVAALPGTGSTAPNSTDVTDTEQETQAKEEELTHDDVRKVLFDDGVDRGKQIGESKEDIVAQAPTEDDVTFSATLDEQPFDAKADYEADEMLDLEETLPSDFGRQNRADMHEINVARKLLDVFNCNDDTTRSGKKIAEKITCGGDLFYDTVCGSYVDGQKRPYYSLEFTLKFLEEATKTGIPLLNHVPPTGSDVEDWTGRSVTMFVRPGNSSGARMLQPTLDWSTHGGGLATDVITVKVDLLSIHSILDSTNIEEEREDDEGSDLCFFTITTQGGDVHVFETQSFEERDRVVNGLKNVIARLAYHLVAGDVQASSELYSEDYGQASGELPSLRTPTRAMNDISHSFLD